MRTGVVKIKRAAGLLMGALLMSVGCASHAAAARQHVSARAAEAPPATPDAAVDRVARQNPSPLERFSRRPGWTACPQNIGGPEPGVVLALTCEMRVAAQGSGWVITLIQAYNYNDPHRFTITYLVSASGRVSQPVFSGDPVPDIP